MDLRIALLVVACIPAALAAAHACMIPWRFTYGKRWYALPFKMAFPALAWPMALIALATAAAATGLFLSCGVFSAAWIAALAVAVIALAAAAAHLYYIARVAAPHGGFARALGANWQARMPLLPGMLKRRWSPRRFPARPVRLTRDVTIPALSGGGRALLADLWQPIEGTKPTGLAFLFFHGSAWHFMDKGVGTDPMCRHLAAQGHLVLDVAYRLAPEADLAGMVADVKQAVAWAKQNACRLGIDPARVVIGGASAGGHISLLAAYGGRHPAFTPPGFNGADTSVAGVVSLYGPCDLRAYVRHHGGRLNMTGKRASAPAPVGFDSMSTEQMMMNLLGGMEDEVPEGYDLADVSAHIRAGGPPALIVQGEVDFVTPVEAPLRLVERLRQAGVPAVYHELPCTEHAWDIGTAMANMALGKRLFPSCVDSQYSPPATAALYDVERFLALIAADRQNGRCAEPHLDI